jgi:hypothetical protein
MKQVVQLVSRYQRQASIVHAGIPQGLAQHRRRASSRHDDER